MKISRTEVLIDEIEEAQKEVFEDLLKEIKDAVEKVVWPLGAYDFTINPTFKGNGVKPIKNGCMAYLLQQGWEIEKRLRVTSDIRPGPIDAVKKLANGDFFALEWETGNISSSHRALNKMAVGILERNLVGGVLILPSRNLYRFLTDRIGNFQEISPYFHVWRNLKASSGFLAVIEIEHEGESSDVELIPKGTDGWARFQ